MVEKSIVADFLIALMRCPQQDTRKRTEIVEMTSSVLSFSDEQKAAVGLLPSDDAHAAEYLPPRLSELWTAFLINQSNTE